MPQLAINLDPDRPDGLAGSKHTVRGGSLHIEDSSLLEPGATDGQQLEGWLTSAKGPQAIARYMATPQAADDFGTGRRPDPNRPPAEFAGPEPLPSYQVVEVTVCTPPPPSANR